MILAGYVVDRCLGVGFEFDGEGGNFADGPRRHSVEVKTCTLHDAREEY